MAPKVTEEYKEERRSFILEGALQCFAEKGYQNTTIDDIGRHLGISKGAIYTYFTSKEEIYVQLMQERMDRMITISKGQFSAIPDASGKLHLLFGRFLGQPLQDLRKLLSFSLEFELYSSRQEELKKYMAQHSEIARTFLSDIIAEGKKSGEFRSDVDEGKAADLFWALRDGLALHFLAGGEEADYQDRLRQMEEMIFRYLKD